MNSSPRVAVSSPGRLVAIRRLATRRPVTALALVALIAGPLIRLLVEVIVARIPLGATWDALSEVLANTFVSSAVAAAIAVVIGLVGTLLVERAGRTTMAQAAMVAPLVVPPFVAAIGWLRAFGPTGLTDDLAGIVMPGLEGGFGVTVVLAVGAAPIAYLVLASAMRSRVSPTLEAAARISGASGRATLRTIVLPLLRPALGAAFGLAFVFGVNAFGVPAVLGTPAGFGTVTTRIYQDLVRAADPAAFDRVLASSSLLMVIAAIVVGFTDLTGGRPTGEVTVARRPARRGARWAVVTLWTYAAVTVGLPVLSLVLAALTKAPGLAPLPANWTIDNFRLALAGPGARAFGISTTLATVAATLVVGLGLLSAVPRRRRVGRTIGFATILGFAVPGSVLAVAIALTYGRLFRDGLVLILLAYLGKFWALGHRTIAGSAAGVSSGPLMAARVSGADARTAMRTVLIPLLAPAMAAAWLIAFLFGFHELTMSSLLYGPGSETLAVVVLNLQQLGDPGATAAMAVLLTAVVVAGGAAGAIIARRSR